MPKPGPKPAKSSNPPPTYSAYMQQATGSPPRTKPTPKPSKPRKPPPDPRQHLGIPIDDTVPTRPATGRPTTYHPSYCNRVIELGAKGYSSYQIAAELDVPRLTMTMWAEKDSEEGRRFRASLARAKDMERNWWERRGQQGLEDRHFNAHLWIKTMQVRFRQDYADRVELTGQDGGPILFQTVYEEPPKTIDVTPGADKSSA